MKKYFLIFALMLMAMGLSFTVVSCSSDDTYMYDGNQQDILTNNEGNIKFRLLNQDGVETTVFKKGENIIFDLSIENNTDVNWTLVYGFKGGDIVLGEDFFCVYKANGEYIGVPWSGMFCEESLQQEWIYLPHSIVHIKCPWYMDSSIWIGNPLCKGTVSGEDWPVLSEGSYYTAFSITYNKNLGLLSPDMKEQKFIIHFEII